MHCGSLFSQSCADSVIILLRVSSISDFIRGHQKHISDDAEQIIYGKVSQIITNYHQIEYSKAFLL